MHKYSSPENKQKVFIELYKPVHQRISNYCKAITWTTEDAKDLLNDCILAAYENFENIKNIESFQYYLFGIANRVLLNNIRRKKYRGEYSEDKVKTIMDLSANAEIMTDVNVFHEILSQLPNKQQKAILLAEVAGFSHKEIQKIQGGSLSGVKSRIARGKKRLKQIMMRINQNHNVETT